jgi:hypothetical protein
VFVVLVSLLFWDGGACWVLGGIDVDVVVAMVVVVVVVGGWVFC